MAKSGADSRDPALLGYRAQEISDFAADAERVKELHEGNDVVEVRPPDQEKRPAAFDRKELQVVRSWVKGRPLEPTNPAAAMIAYPRMWSSKRGRYAKVSLPGTGSYGILRARPSF